MLRYTLTLTPSSPTPLIDDLFHSVQRCDLYATQSRDEARAGSTRDAGAGLGDTGLGGVGGVGEEGSDGLKEGKGKAAWLKQLHVGALHLSPVNTAMVSGLRTQTLTESGIEVIK